MTDDRERITAGLLELAACTGAKLDEARIVAYLKRLLAHPPERVMASIDRLCTTARFFPSVAEILAGASGSDTLQAADAWTRWSQAGLDPATDETLRLLGGRTAIGRLYEDRMAFVRKEFLTLYPDVRAKLDAEAATKRAAAKIEAAPTPRKIGGKA
jgi:hypothetical protein